MIKVYKSGVVIMIVLDEITNNSLSNITILLQKNEAIQMIGYLEDLLSNATQNEHCHLNNDNYSKEITIALYDKKRLEGFEDKYKELISEEM